MTSLPFKTESLNRYDLPAYERKGAVAQELFRNSMVIVKFSQTKTVVESPAGLPVLDLDAVVYKTIPRSGIDNTIVVGVPNKNIIWLLDVLSLGGSSVRGKSWKDRLDLLKDLCDGFSSEGIKVFPRSKLWDRGLMKAYTVAMKKGDTGLLVRVVGKTKAFIC